MKRSAVALVAGLLLCLAGCGKATDPPPVADPAASVPPTKSGPVEPVLPDVATRETKAGAIAFAKYYWRVVDYSQRTLDTSLLRTLAMKSCAACDGGADELDKIRRDGGTIRGGIHRMAGAWAPDPGSLRSTHFIGVIVRVSVTKQIVSADGGRRSYAAGTDLIPMTLEFTSMGWQVTSWHVAS